MGHWPVAVVNWLGHISINWDAASAIGTFLATAVALFLPLWITRREWERQDRLRQEDITNERQKRVDVQHEVCSAVDRVLAYRDAAIALFGSAPVYTVGIEAIAKVQLNTQFLAEVLDLFKCRTELSDGAVYSAVAARKIADAVIRETSYVVYNWGVNDPGWAAREDALRKLDQLAAIAQARSDGVRNHYGLPSSGSAMHIRQKYLPLAAAIKEAIAADSGAPANIVADSPD